MRRFLAAAAVAGALVPLLAGPSALAQTYSDGNVGTLTTKLAVFVSVVGADPSGAADSTTIIQNAINSLPLGGHLWVPPGRFKISGLTIPTDGIEIIGSGEGTTTFVLSSSTGTAFKSSNQAITRSFVRLRDFSLAGPFSAGSVGIDFSSFTDSEIHNVYVSDFGTQMLIDGGLGGNTFYNSFGHMVFFASNASSGFTGVKLSRASNAQTFVACRWHRLTTQAVIGDAASSLTSMPNQIDFLNASFEAADSLSVNVVRGQSINIYGGRFESDPTGIQTAADNLVRAVVVDAPYFNTVATPILDQAAAVTLRGGGTGGVASIATNNSTAAGPNLLPNAKFEGWDGAASLLGWASASSANWNTTGTVAREPAVLHSGTFAAKGGDGTTTFKGLSEAAQIPVDPTKPYTLTFWWTAPDVNSKLRYAFRLFDSANNVITTGNLLGVQWSGDSNTVTSSPFTYNAGFNSHILGSDRAAAAANVYQRESVLVMFPPGTASVRLA